MEETISLYSDGVKAEKREIVGLALYLVMYASSYILVEKYVKIESLSA